MWKYEPPLITIVYDPCDGLTLPDGKIQKWVDDTLIKKQPATGMILKYRIASARILDHIRLAIIQEKIKPEDFVLEHEGKNYFIDKYGVFDWEPDCPHLRNDLISKMVRLQMQKRIADNKGD